MILKQSFFRNIPFLDQQKILFGQQNFFYLVTPFHLNIYTLFTYSRFFTKIKSLQFGFVFIDSFLGNEWNKACLIEIKSNSKSSDIDISPIDTRFSISENILFFIHPRQAKVNIFFTNVSVSRPLTSVLQDNFYLLFAWVK